MKISRALAMSVMNAPKETKVECWLNEALPESRDDHQLLAEIQTQAATEYLGLTIVETPPFQHCLVFVRNRSDRTHSVVMVSPQAAALLFTDTSEEVLASSEKGGYGCTRGWLDGCPFLGLISTDRERVVVVACAREAVIDTVASVIFECRTMKATIPAPVMAGSVPRWDRLPDSAEMLILRVDEVCQALELLTKYAIAYLEEIPSEHNRRRGKSPHRTAPPKE